MTPGGSALRAQDVVEIAIGSAALAFPVATTEEVWNLSSELSAVRVALLGLTSLVIVAVFVVVVYHREGRGERPQRFWHRVAAVYLVTLVVCAGILALLDRLPLLTDLDTAIKRTILVSFPASFSATVVDSLS